MQGRSVRFEGVRSGRKVGGRKALQTRWSEGMFPRTFLNLRSRKCHFLRFPVSRKRQYRDFGVVLYNAGIVDCTVEEVVSMDRKTLHTRSNVARLYLPRKEGKRGLIGVEECVKEKCKSLHGYRRNSTEWMLRIVLKEKVLVRREFSGVQ